MPLSWPYGVTGPVVGQMFHVKHWLWRRSCSGCRRPRPLCRPGCSVCSWAAARPRAVRAASFARRVVSKPGQAPPPPTGTAARPSSAGRPRGVLCIDAPCGDALVERGVGERCRVPVRVCKKSAAPAGLRTCVELRCGRNSLSGGRPSPGAWRRRAR